jgi:4-amino-4-deoxy-L-arabinose transferase-like glycosyltransferase
MSETHARRWLLLIVISYFLLAILYSFTTPPFEASDELWHYPMVKYVADNGLQLPPQDPNIATSWRQEGSQPPLYYMIAAILTSGIDTSDMDYWRRINPHADIGVVRPDGNANMIVHRPEESANRFIGALLALQISRFLSIALGAGTVIVTFALARALFPARPDIALIAATFNAFLPMFLFISGSVNNDNLSTLLSGVLTLLVVRLLQEQRPPRLLDYGQLGIACGTSILSKMNLGFFIPLVALALLIISIRRRDWRPLVIGGVVSGALTIAIGGWWYLRNWQLYGDPTGLNMFLDIVGRRAIPANLAQLWSERDSFLWAFWGFFGGVNVPLATWVYTIFNMLAGIAIIGGVVYCISAITRALQQRTNRRDAESAMEHSLASSASLRFSFSFSIAHLVSLLWILVTFVSYLRWTAETPASQGRLMFGALSAISVWVAVGWAWWLPQRLAFVFVLPLLLVSATTPTGVIQPVYSSPPISIISPQAEAAIFIASDDGDIAVVENGGVTRQSITPENYVLIVPTFAVVERLARDWSLFVHLVTPDGVIIGQRDVYPARGLLATSDLEVGHTWYNPIAVWIPANAYAPQTLEIVLGWYHLPSGERMRLEDGSETLTLGQVELRLRESDLNVPNPITINFGNQIELVGYSLSDLSPAAGDDVMLTLYWRALRPLMTDYTVFAQILDSATTTIYGASDAQPAAWTRPTSSWVVGEIIEDIHTLTINPDTPTSPGIYDIYVGLYTRGDDGSFNRLRVISPDGGQAFDYTELSRVRVLPQGDL